MKGFEREDDCLSLCGLNCGLCPMRWGGYCGGCGQGNASCAIARCSLTHSGIAYCYECPCYPCEKYEHAGEFDSFITHRHQKADLEKAQRMGVTAYQQEQREKREMLGYLLSYDNDGRRKSFFCLAVNLLALEDLRDAMQEIRAYDAGCADSVKARASHAVTVLQQLADRRHMILKLNRRKKQRESE